MGYAGSQFHRGPNYLQDPLTPLAPSPPPVTPLVLECRVRGGSLSLCGFTEFVPSTPARAYKTLTFSGVVTFEKYASTPCSGALQCPNVEDNWSGVFTCDPANDCQIITNEEEQLGFGYLNRVANGCSNPADQQAAFNQSTLINDFGRIGFLGFYNVTKNTTATERTLVPPGCMTGSGLGANPLWRVIESTAAETLTAEDTEADAIARWQAALPAWTEWTATFDPPDRTPADTCFNTPCCISQWELRTDSFTWQYWESQWRATGLTPLTEYTVEMDVYRRAYGTTDSFVLFSTITVTVTSDVDGTITGEIPSEPGFDSYVTNAFLV